MPRLRILDAANVRQALTAGLAGLTFRIYPQTFFQTNTAGAELLLQRIKDEVPLTPESRVLGLYCGSGAIELSLAGAVGEVTGVDSSPANIATAVENALINRIGNAEFVPGTVEALVGGPLRGPADVVIVDPPRAGLTGKALRQVSLVAAPTKEAVGAGTAEERVGVGGPVPVLHVEDERPDGWGR